MLSSILIIITRIYQKFLSPIKPKRVKCRFYPTCSGYAIQAIRKYGAVKGTKKTINRLKRCNPYNRDSCIDYP
ncbi:membrane protein insertion efficiency factor YidD [Cytobacillus oceanisediminis]|uniref:membrane protein insertion efficiency factor YidD n=1 Tax=Cytobacillus oceanisediminis TaxID=665099 RepID=UPI001FB42E0A|nr:membrane protein insertion efficiency factor YidD [Cytobacillus oceanisediminis]UOE54906.1 membrane protein insertion efficiency factor YidD [Cytobacillus oceanisediminis]